jgi:hypothetical protein
MLLFYSFFTHSRKGLDALLSSEKTPYWVPAGRQNLVYVHVAADSDQGQQPD